MKTRIPDKLYFKIGEVAKLADVPAHVLRYWESEFPGIRPKRANSKQRLYRYQDVELVLKVKVLLHEKGYTIAGARKLLESGDEPQPPVAEDQHRPEEEKQKLSQIKEELLKLQNLLKTAKE